MHRVRDGDRRRTRTRLRTVAILSQATEFGALAQTHRAGIDPDLLHEFSVDLGLPATSLQSFRVGLAQGDEVAELGLRWASKAWTFPMEDARGDVIGLRVRLPQGQKLCAKGSRLGLFVPTDLPESLATLHVAEGETDAAALHALGLASIGRPGCRACARLVIEFVRTRQPGEVVIVADADEEGQAGADALARNLVAVAPAVRVITPPDGHKDIRAWVRAGARSEDVMFLAGLAPVRGVEVKSRRRGR